MPALRLARATRKPWSVPIPPNRLGYWVPATRHCSAANGGTCVANMTPTLSHQAKPSDDVLFQEVGDEAVLLNLASERYFGLDPSVRGSGPCFAEDPRLQQAFDTLCAEYESNRPRLETDLLDLVGQLAEAKLVQVA